MSYTTKCEVCRVPISMEDDFDEGDDRRCEECRAEDTTERGHFFGDPDQSMGPMGGPFDGE